MEPTARKKFACNNLALSMFSRRVASLWLAFAPLFGGLILNIAALRQPIDSYAIFFSVQSAILVLVALFSSSTRLNLRSDECEDELVALRSASLGILLVGIILILAFASNEMPIHSSSWLFSVLLCSKKLVDHCRETHSLRYSLASSPDTVGSTGLVAYVSVGALFDLALIYGASRTIPGSIALLAVYIFWSALLTCRNLMLLFSISRKTTFIDSIKRVLLSDRIWIGAVIGFTWLTARLIVSLFGNDADATNFASALLPSFFLVPILTVAAVVFLRRHPIWSWIAGGATGAAYIGLWHGLFPKLYSILDLPQVSDSGMILVSGAIVSATAVNLLRPKDTSPSARAGRGYAALASAIIVCASIYIFQQVSQELLIISFKFFLPAPCMLFLVINEVLLMPTTRSARS